MKPTRVLTPTNPLTPLFPRSAPKFASSVKWGRPYSSKFPAAMATTSHGAHLTDHSLSSSSSPSGIVSEAAADSSAFFHSPPSNKLQSLEENIEKAIYSCRFLTILAVWGSLVGSLLCFIKGCTYVMASYQQYMVNRVKVILLLVEAIDIYLLGTVMLVFGMGLYELFISNLDIGKRSSEDSIPYRSNLFGLFPLKERPQWLEIKSVNELKTKLGHVIVMLLLIGLFEKSKKAVIHSSTDLLCFAASVLLSSCCLLLLSKLNGYK